MIPLSGLILTGPGAETSMIGMIAAWLAVAAVSIIVALALLWLALREGDS